MCYSYTNTAATTAAVANRFVTSTNMKVGAYTLANTTPVWSGAGFVTVTHTEVGGGVDTLGTIVVVGVDLSGQTRTDTITPVNGTTATGVIPFRTITSVTGVGWEDMSGERGGPTAFGVHPALTALVAEHGDDNWRLIRDIGVATGRIVAHRTTYDVRMRWQALQQPKQRWTADEERLFVHLIKRHGAGNWARILADSEAAGTMLASRGGQQLRTKWRNLLRYYPEIQPQPQPAGTVLHAGDGMPMDEGEGEEEEEEEDSDDGEAPMEAEAGAGAGEEVMPAVQ
jgi:hypothetical protein